VYVRSTPPDDSVLMSYGATFAEFLARFEPAKPLSYLPGVAQLDRLWTESHMARDDTLLAPHTLTQLEPRSITDVVLYPHAAARCVWFDSAPIFSIWSRNRDASNATDEPWSPDWQSEGALLTRPHGTVQWLALDKGAHLFVETCANGGPLGQAAAAALAVNENINLQHWMSKLLAAGAFSRASISHSRSSRK
jgi:hypothetical protein